MIDSCMRQSERLESQASRPVSPTDGCSGSNNNNNNNRLILSSSSSSSSSSNSNSSSSEKYALRPRSSIKRLQQERGRQQVARGYKGLTRPKSRPAPLSKYRRKTANARERHRMREINNAFESLRRVLPEALEVETTSANMTKITTLRLAADYIRALSGVLQEGGGAALRSLPAPSLHHHHHHLLDLFSSSHAATTASRTSLSSSTCSDLDELLSDDSCSLLDDSFDVFHDITSLPLPDSLDLLLEEERDAFTFTTELCN